MPSWRRPHGTGVRPTGDTPTWCARPNSSSHRPGPRRCSVPTSRRWSSAAGCNRKRQSPRSAKLDRGGRAFSPISPIQTHHGAERHLGLAQADRGHGHRDRLPSRRGSCRHVAPRHRIVADTGVPGHRSEQLLAAHHPDRHLAHGRASGACHRAGRHLTRRQACPLRPDDHLEAFPARVCYRPARSFPLSFSYSFPPRNACSVANACTVSGWSGCRVQVRDAAPSSSRRKRTSMYGLVEEVYILAALGPTAARPSSCGSTTAACTVPAAIQSARGRPARSVERRKTLCSRQRSRSSSRLPLASPVLPRS